MHTRSNLSIVRIALLTVVSLIVSLVSTATLAAPPATVASCEGIQDAYPILGTQCFKNLGKINIWAGNASERRETYSARLAVLQIFRKALLCNSVYGAPKAVRQTFISGEQRQLQDLSTLNKAMMAAGDPDVPAVYKANDLPALVNKSECR